jgi:hypothetical protein
VVQTPERIFMHDEADRQTDRQASWIAPVTINLCVLYCES